ncbi:507_t:CDS:2, partial [Gigaspora rosea]
STRHYDPRMAVLNQRSELVHQHKTTPSDTSIYNETKLLTNQDINSQHETKDNTDNYKGISIQIKPPVQRHMNESTNTITPDDTTNIQVTTHESPSQLCDNTT